MIKLTRISFICLLILQAIAPTAFAIEPQIYNGDKTPSYVSTLDLDHYSGAGERYFNILILGLDVRNRKKREVKIDGIGLPVLASRSDSVNVLSLDMVEGRHALFSLYRGAIPDSDCWRGADVVPPESERYLANLFLFTPRRNFIECIRTQVARNIVSVSLEEGYGARLSGGRLPIHATLEVDVRRMKAAMSELGVLAIKSAGTTLEVLNESGFGITDLLSLSRIVDGLRNRNDYGAAGYQRAFNHAKFMTYSLGYIGKLMSKDHGFFTKTSEVFRYLSSSLRFLSLQALLNTHLAAMENETVYSSFLFRPRDDGKFVSPIEICEFGPASSALIYAKGKRFGKGLTRSNLLLKVDTNLLPIPNPEKKEHARQIGYTKGRLY